MLTTELDIMIRVQRGTLHELVLHRDSLRSVLVKVTQKQPRCSQYVNLRTRHWRKPAGEEAEMPDETKQRAIEVMHFMGWMV